MPAASGCPCPTGATRRSRRSTPRPSGRATPNHRSTVMPARRGSGSRRRRGRSPSRSRYRGAARGGTIDRKSLLTRHRAGGVGRPAYTANVDVPSPLLDGLNDIQREAVLHTEGPVLIVAGRRQRQDAGPHAPDRLPRAGARRRAGPDPRDHLHEQGGPRDARPRRGLGGHGRGRRACGSSRSTRCAPGCCGGSTRIWACPRASRSTTTATRSGWSPASSATSTSTRSGSRPRQLAAAIGHAKDQVLGARRVRRAWPRTSTRRSIAKVYQRLRDAQARGRRARLRRPDHRDGPAVPRAPRGAAATTRSGSATCWSTSTRTRAAPSTSW